MVKIYLEDLFTFCGLFPCESEPWTRIKDVDNLVRTICMLENQLKINVLLTVSHGDHIQMWDRAVLYYELDQVL